MEMEPLELSNHWSKPPPHSKLPPNSLPLNFGPQQPTIPKQRQSTARATSTSDQEHNHAMDECGKKITEVGPSHLRRNLLAVSVLLHEQAGCKMTPL